MIFGDRIILCSPGWHRTWILPSPLLQCWDHRYMPPCSANFTIFTLWLWMMVCWTFYFLVCLNSLVLTCRMSSSCSCRHTFHPSLFSVPWQMTGSYFIGAPVLWFIVGLGRWETQTRLWWWADGWKWVTYQFDLIFPLLILLLRQYLSSCSPGWPISDLPALAPTRCFFRLR